MWSVLYGALPLAWRSLSADERRELVEGGAPPGLGVAAALGREGPVAECHARLVAVVVELHAHDRGLVHAHLRHRVRAQDDQLRLHELEDVVADRELAAAAAPDHRELPAPADAQVDADPLARRFHVLGAVPGRHLVGVGPGSEHPLARRFEDARDQDLLIGGRLGGRVTHLALLSGAGALRVGPSGPPTSACATASTPQPRRAGRPAAGSAATEPPGCGRSVPHARAPW